MFYGTINSLCGLKLSSSYKRKLPKSIFNTNHQINNKKYEELKRKTEKETKKNVLNFEGEKVEINDKREKWKVEQKKKKPVADPLF